MVVVGKKDFAVGWTKSLRLGVGEEIAQKSPYMATRQTSFNKDISDFYEDSKGGAAGSRWNDFRTVMGKLGFWLMTKVQWHLVDIPTWMAGYHQGLRRFGNDEAKAIAHADDVVKRAQSSGLFQDRSAVERGSLTRTTRQNDFVRLLTALGSYMFAKFNVAYEKTAKTGQTIGDKGLSMQSAQAAMAWTIDMAFLFTLEAVAVQALTGKLGGDDDGEDEGWAAYLAKQTGLAVMGTVPLVRDAASVFQGFDGGGAYGSIVGDLAKPFVELSKSWEKGEVSKSFVKSTIAATGVVTGAPSTQVNRAVDAAWRQSQGEDVSPVEYLFGRLGR